MYIWDYMGVIRARHVFLASFGGGFGIRFTVHAVSGSGSGHSEVSIASKPGRLELKYETLST